MRTYDERKEYFKAYRDSHKEQRSEYLREYKKTYNLDRRKTMASDAKTRAKLDGLPCDITYKDIEIPEVCPILGVPLKRNKGGGPRFCSPSLDKIIPELGYVKSNIQVISMRANVMKNDASPDELRKFAEWVLKTFPP